jgi:hypothetical protein
MMPTVILRPVIASDLPIIFEQMSDPESSAIAAVPSRDKEAFDAHWKKIMSNEDTGWGKNFGGRELPQKR